MPQPLAARLRPNDLNEILGQEHILGTDAPFRKALKSGHMPSVLLWGPPGCGKTTTLQMIALILLLLASDAQFAAWLDLAGIGLLYAAAAITLWSMVEYLRLAWPELGDD